MWTPPIEVLVERIDNHSKEIDEIKVTIGWISKIYINKDQYEVVRLRLRMIEKIVYGLVTVVLIAFITSLSNLWIHKW
jgi:hypothetical protein